MSPPEGQVPRLYAGPRLSLFVREDMESQAFWQVFSKAVEEGQGLLRDSMLFNPYLEAPSRVDWIMERTFIEIVCLPLLEGYWVFQRAYWYPLEMVPPQVRYAIALQGSTDLIKTKTVGETEYFMVNVEFLYRITGVPRPDGTAS